MIDIAVQSSEGDVFHKFKEYAPHGMVQPAILIVGPNMKILAEWVHIPTEVRVKNLLCVFIQCHDCV